MLQGDALADVPDADSPIDAAAAFRPLCSDAPVQLATGNDAGLVNAMTVVGSWMVWSDGDGSQLVKLDMRTGAKSPITTVGGIVVSLVPVPGGAGTVVYARWEPRAGQSAGHELIDLRTNDITTLDPACASAASPAIADDKYVYTFGFDPNAPLPWTNRPICRLALADGKRAPDLGAFGTSSNQTPLVGGPFVDAARGLVYVSDGWTVLTTFSITSGAENHLGTKNDSGSFQMFAADADAIWGIAAYNRASAVVGHLARLTKDTSTLTVLDDDACSSSPGCLQGSLVIDDTYLYYVWTTDASHAAIAQRRKEESAASRWIPLDSGPFPRISIAVDGHCMYWLDAPQRATPSTLRLMTISK
jgi:hypothetical protein